MLLFLLVHFKIVRFNLFWKLSPFIVLVLLLFGLLIPDELGRAAGIGHRRSQRRGDCAERRRRGDRSAGRRQYAAESR